MVCCGAWGWGVRGHCTCSCVLLGPGLSSSLNMSVWQVPRPGILELSHLKEGAYILQLTVTDTVGQRSSDNVSVSVLPRIYSTGGEKKVLPLSSPPTPTPASHSPVVPGRMVSVGFYIPVTRFTGSSIVFLVLEVFAKNIITNTGSLFRTIWSLWLECREHSQSIEGELVGPVC